MGSPKESLEEKNIFAENYDEIRRLDGTHILAEKMKTTHTDKRKQDSQRT